MTPPAPETPPVVTLTPEDAAVIFAAIEAPPAPEPRLLEAVRAYRARVAHAD